jgi:hypothetical protein
VGPGERPDEADLAEIDLGDGVEHVALMHAAGCGPARSYLCLELYAARIYKDWVFGHESRGTTGMARRKVRGVGQSVGDCLGIATHWR